MLKKFRIIGNFASETNGCMDFKAFGKDEEPTLMLIPGLAVSYEIFLPVD